MILLIILKCKKMKFFRGIYYFKYSTFPSLIFKVASVFSRQFIYKILNYDFVYFGLLFAILRFSPFRDFAFFAFLCILCFAILMQRCSFVPDLRC